MLKTWLVIFKDFLNDRTTELYDHLILHDRKHARLAKESRHAMNQLTASLAPEQHELFLDYESAVNCLLNREDELIYQQGLIDGLRMGYYIDKIRRGRME